MNLREWLPAISYDRPVTVLMAGIALLVVGLIATVRIPTQMMPDGFEPGFLWVWVPYPNAAPTETDDKVVSVVEAQLGTVSGISRLRSSAESNGASFAVQFHSSVDMDEAYNSVVDRLERAMTDLPDDVERYMVYRFNPNDQPIVWAGVQLPEDIEDPYHVMTRIVQPRLERINGVASLDVWGVPRRGVWIYYDKERLYTHGINTGEVQRRLATDNFQMASGKLDDRGQVRHVRSLARMTGPDDIADYPVKDDLVLSDIAEVQYGAALSSDINRINGEEAAAIAIRKESSANTVEVSREVARVLEELEADPRVQGAKFFVFFSQGDLISDSIDTLANTAATGGLFAVLILYLFLREWRMTLLIAASIPFSLLITIGVLYFRGDSLNLLSLMGLMLAVGMVVDNAIVVVETIYRRRAEGAGVRAAAIGGTAEVNLAILLSTATTMVVFLPVILMSENAQLSFFMAVLGLPVVFALAASLVVALVFSPLATKAMGSARIRPDPRWLEWLTERYVGVLTWTLHHRADAALILVVGLVVTFGMVAPQLKTTDGGDENLNDFTIRLEVPPQFGLRDRMDTIDQFEAVLEAHREDWGIRVYRSRLGSDSSQGRIFVYIDADGPMTREEVMEEAKGLMPRDIPGVKASIGWDSGEDGSGSGNRIELAIEGEDLDLLAGLAEEVARRTRGLPGVMEAHVDAINDGGNELHLVADRDALSRYGVSAMQVGQNVAYVMRGNALKPLRDGDKEIAVQSEFHPDDKRGLDKLLNFDVWSPAKNALVPIRSLTDVEVTKGPRSIRRVNRRTSTTVTLDLDEDATTSEVFAEVDGALADMAFPQGYSWSKGFRFEQTQEDDEALRLAMLLSVCFVFLLMGVLFESFILPLSIITTVPMAMGGAIWLLVLTGTPLGALGNVGIVILVGVVVNNGIVLVDLVTQLRADGVERTEALIEAGRRRIRPILMTALTTICGLVPMAFGSSSFIGIPYAPLGRTVIGGLGAATVLTLLFIPFLYALLDDLRTSSMVWFAYVRGARA